MKKFKPLLLLLPLSLLLFSCASYPSYTPEEAKTIIAGYPATTYTSVNSRIAYRVQNQDEVVKEFNKLLISDPVQNDYSERDDSKYSILTGLPIKLDASTFYYLQNERYVGQYNDINSVIIGGNNQAAHMFIMDNDEGGLTFFTNSSANLYTFYHCKQSVTTTTTTWGKLEVNAKMEVHANYDSEGYLHNETYYTVEYGKDMNTSVRFEAAYNYVV